MNEEQEPTWFIRWKSNDFFHLNLKIAKIEERVGFSTKLSLALLGITIAGIVALVVGFLALT